MTLTHLRRRLGRPSQPLTALVIGVLGLIAVAAAAPAPFASAEAAGPGPVSDLIRTAAESLGR